jgi:hypothetical protein
MAKQYRYPEAILTIGKSLYRDPRETPDRLRAYLNEYRDVSWLFESLARETPVPPEKEGVLVEVARTLPMADRVLKAISERQSELLAESTTDPHTIKFLFDSQVPGVWRGLASNPHTPQPILQTLREVKGIRYSREIRLRAQDNLACREQG